MPEKIKRLNDDDLQEFRLRQQALVVARNQFLLVQESVTEWTKRTGKKYRVKGRFSVSASDGSITPVSDDTPIPMRPEIDGQVASIG